MKLKKIEDYRDNNRNFIEIMRETNVDRLRAIANTHWFFKNIYGLLCVCFASSTLFFGVKTYNKSERLSEAGAQNRAAKDIIEDVKSFGEDGDTYTITSEQFDVLNEAINKGGNAIENKKSEKENEELKAAETPWNRIKVPDSYQR